MPLSPWSGDNGGAIHPSAWSRYNDGPCLYPLYPMTTTGAFIHPLDPMTTMGPHLYPLDTMTIMGPCLQSRHPLDPMTTTGPFIHPLIPWQRRDHASIPLILTTGPCIYPLIPWQRRGHASIPLILTTGPCIHRLIPWQRQGHAFTLLIPLQQRGRASYDWCIVVAAVTMSEFSLCKLYLMNCKHELCLVPTVSRPVTNEYNTGLINLESEFDEILHRVTWYDCVSVCRHRWVCHLLMSSVHQYKWIIQLSV